MLKRFIPLRARLALERLRMTAFPGSAHETLVLEAIAVQDTETLRMLLDIPQVRFGVREMLDSPEFVESLAPETYAQIWTHLLVHLHGLWGDSGLLVTAWSVSRIETPADHLAALAVRLEELCQGDTLNRALQQMWSSRYSDPRVLAGAWLATVSQCLTYAPSREIDSKTELDAHFGEGISAAIQTLVAEEPECRVDLRTFVDEVEQVRHVLPLVIHARSTRAATSLRGAISLVASLPALGAGVASQLVQGGTDLAWDDLVALAANVEHTESA